MTRVALRSCSRSDGGSMDRSPMQANSLRSRWPSLVILATCNIGETSDMSVCANKLSTSCCLEYELVVLVDRRTRSSRVKHWPSHASTSLPLTFANADHDEAKTLSATGSMRFQTSEAGRRQSNSSRHAIVATVLPACHVAQALFSLQARPRIEEATPEVTAVWT